MQGNKILFFQSNHLGAHEEVDLREQIQNKVSCPLQKAGQSSRAETEALRGDTSANR